MKVALLSDIHGNDLALQTVLKEAYNANVTEILVCGDIVGYYYDTDKVLELLDKWKWTTCRGNHEEIFTNRVHATTNEAAVIDAKYGSAYCRALKSLRGEQIYFLSNLPHPLVRVIDGLKFTICHGSPWDIEYYLYPTTLQHVLSNFDNYSKDFDVIVYGHTHYQDFRKYGAVCLINPGSVGQPRSRKTHLNEGYAFAEWGVFDTEQRSYQAYSSIYNVEPLLKKINENDPHFNYLKSVFSRR